MSDAILKIEDLKVYFYSEQGTNRVIDGLNLEIGRSEIRALVGGSGSGKTLTGLSILRLQPPQANVIGGKIFWKDKDILEHSDEDMRKIRGKEISMVFQEPLTSLNPVFTIGYQISEAIRLHTNLKRKEIREKAIELLRKVRIGQPEKIISDYPHQLSGGLRQRVMIAMAIAGNPKLIIADEPTSNLDVTLQAQILKLFRELRDTLNLSILLITHDLAVVSHLANHVSIMHDGRIIEEGSTVDVLDNPKENYTKKLIKAVSI
ncbi:MAG: ABC transporter ATP-binding protein [Candidatus Omnitrophota bacterium]